MKLIKKSGIDFIIVGLGNPGNKYENTRHNIGFRVADILMKGETVKTKFEALYSKVTIFDSKCIIMKPQTYMNNSGSAVAQMANFYKVPTENIIVISDDISLEPGRIRVRRRGSDGGHNGIKDIINFLGSDDFPRVKVGIGDKPSPDYDLADFVLGKFLPDEQDKIERAILRANDAVKSIIKSGVEYAMNSYNGV